MRRRTDEPTGLPDGAGDGPQTRSATTMKTRAKPNETAEQSTERPRTTTTSDTDTDTDIHVQ